MQLYLVYPRSSIRISARLSRDHPRQRNVVPVPRRITDSQSHSVINHPRDRSPFRSKLIDSHARILPDRYFTFIPTLVSEPRRPQPIHLSTLHFSLLLSFRRVRFCRVHTILAAEPSASFLHQGNVTGSGTWQQIASTILSSSIFHDFSRCLKIVGPLFQREGTFSEKKMAEGRSPTAVGRDR